MAQVSIKNKTAKGVLWSSPQSELFEDRYVFLTGAISDATAEETIMQLLCLHKASDDPITLVINSPGGSVPAGLAIIDCMHALRCPVRVHGIGMVASMAATILACGEKGGRTLSPRADVLIHQPLTGGVGGQASDVAIAVESILNKRRQLNRMLAQACGKTERQIEKATDRDHWMNAEEAVAFGLADAVQSPWE